MTESSENDALSDAVGRSRHQHKRLFLVFVGASASLHAAVLVLVPGPLPGRSPPAASRLEVMVLRPVPMPVAAADPAREPPTASPPSPHVAPAAAQPKADPVRPALVTASPAPAPAVEERRPLSMDAGHRETGTLAQPTPEPLSRVAGAAAPESHAMYLRTPPPRYPPAARRAGVDGAVTLRVLVTREGLPGRVDVEKSSGSANLDGAALEAVKAWRFVPARRGAEPLESWMLVPVVFRLEGTG